MQKQLLLFILGVFICEATIAQIGFSAYYDNKSAEGWEQISGKTWNNAIQIGVNTHLKLSDLRVEFLPELYAGFSLKNDQVTNTPTRGEFYYFNPQYMEFGLGLNTRFYFMDMDGDCNCPTFNKDGTFLKKGLFLFIHPKVAYLIKKLEYGTALVKVKPDVTYESDSNDVIYGGGIGLGLDIGISKNLTVTPTIGFEITNPSDYTIPEDCLECGFNFSSKRLNAMRIGLTFEFFNRNR